MPPSLLRLNSLSLIVPREHDIDECPGESPESESPAEKKESRERAFKFTPPEWVGPLSTHNVSLLVVKNGGMLIILCFLRQLVANVVGVQTC